MNFNFGNEKEFFHILIVSNILLEDQPQIANSKMSTLVVNRMINSKIKLLGCSCQTSLMFHVKQICHLYAQVNKNK